MPSIPRLIPDLLSAEPTVRVDLTALRQTLVFAFATGGEIEAFERALEGASLPESDWDRAHFARDLFLDDLVDRCLGVRIGARVYAPCKAHMLRVISEPPRDPAVVAVRREVLAELVSSKDRRAELEQVYVDLMRLRALLCMARQPVACSN